MSSVDPGGPLLPLVGAVILRAKLQDCLPQHLLLWSRRVIPNPFGGTLSQQMLHRNSSVQTHLAICQQISG